MAKPTDKVKRIRKANARVVKESTVKLTTADRFYKKIILQVHEEYDIAWRFVRPRIQEGFTRLKLYNNQRRDKDRVGDPFLFTNHQTLLAALYIDKLAVSFIGREEGDQDMGDNLDHLANFDQDEMEKATHDYMWLWDTLAWGRGLSYFDEFDVDSKTPIPEVWDPLTFMRDPNAQSVNGNRLGTGAMQYGGREVTLTKRGMEKNGEYFNLHLLKNEGGENTASMTFEVRQARQEAQGVQTALAGKSKSDEYTVLQWFTYIDGEKYLIELANERTLIIRMKRLEDADEKPAKHWPLIDRPCYAMAHDWDGVSVFDISEDKQRFRAALLNVFGDSAKADLYPMYFYDETKLKKSIDKTFGFNKFIPVEGSPRDVVLPMQKSQPSAQAQFIMNFLDESAQRALATPEIQQGVPSTKERTLGELEMVSASVGTRYSLTARIFGWSERAFWRRWYDIYDRDFGSDIGKKVMRIAGTFGPQWRDITRDKIITSNILGPDIKIESAVVSEAQKMRDFQKMQVYFGMVAQDPRVDILYGFRHLGRKLMPKDQVERLIPLTFDEREAKEENELLNKGKPARVLVDQNHVVHLRVLAGAKDGPQKDAHKKAHEQMLLRQREIPEAFNIPQEPVLPPTRETAKTTQQVQEGATTQLQQE